MRVGFSCAVADPWPEKTAMPKHRIETRRVSRMRMIFSSFRFGYSVPAAVCCARAATSKTARRRAAIIGCGDSFDHLVGNGEQRWRDGEAECFGSAQIDHQLE